MKISFRKMRFSIILFLGALVGCATNHQVDVKRGGDVDVVKVNDLSELRIGDNVKRGPSKDLVLGKKDVEALLSEWSDGSDSVLSLSGMPIDKRDEFRLLITFWGIYNRNACNEYDLIKLERQSLNPSEVKTAYKNLVQFSPISYSEIWNVRICGNMYRWQVADDREKGQTHALLPD